MGADPLHVDKAIRAAISQYEGQLGATLPPNLRSHKQLQAELTEPLHTARPWRVS